MRPLALEMRGWEGKEGCMSFPVLIVSPHLSPPPNTGAPTGEVGGGSAFREAGYLAGVWGGHLDLVSHLDLVGNLEEAKRVRR